MANLHAVLRMNGRLIDITPHPLRWKEVTIIIETRMTVKKARSLTKKHQATFLDVCSKAVSQESGINFFDQI
jgi:hypothetical protein